ncbi:hypothetical protein [Neomicrococcus lactis]|nr:hypothetical protein [Neomicrococcus lactis]
MSHSVRRDQAAAAEASHCHTTTCLGFAGLVSTLGSLREGYQILLARS